MSDYEKAKVRLGKRFIRNRTRMKKRARRQKTQIDIQLRKKLARNKDQWDEANKKLKMRHKKTK